jgi:hypothetical protein
LSGFGFHAVASPVAMSRAASPRRSAPPIVAKWPPTYIVEPEMSSALTGAPALGFHAVARPFAASSAAMPLREAPPIERR